MEVWAGDSQQGSVSRNPLVIGHQDHITELAVLPLFIETSQDFNRLIHTAEHLQHRGQNILYFFFKGIITRGWLWKNNLYAPKKGYILFEQFSHLNTSFIFSSDSY